jgi:hypothetical protein
MQMLLNTAPDAQSPSHAIAAEQGHGWDLLTDALDGI